MISPNIVPETEPSAPTSPARRTSAFALTIAWLVVAVPAVWGISQTLRTSVRLFETSTSVSNPTPPAAR